MSREIVFDIETVGDIKDRSTMKVTVVSIYDYETDTYHSFEEHELHKLWPFFEKTERMIGYNSEHFDAPILNRYYTGDFLQFPHLDLLSVIRLSAGKRMKLQDIAQATLQIGKSADGLKAMEWFKAGEIDKVKKYCEQDVKVTKELYEFGRKNKMLYYAKLTGELVPIAVNFDPLSTEEAVAVKSGINMTLPF